MHTPNKQVFVDVACVIHYKNIYRFFNQQKPQLIKNKDKMQKRRGEKKGSSLTTHSTLLFFQAIKVVTVKKQKPMDSDGCKKAVYLVYIYLNQ